MPIYDNMMDNPDYFREKKGRIFRIAYMTPEEYLHKCYDMHSTLSQRAGRKMYSYEDYIASMVIPRLADEYAEKMKKGEKFPMPVIDYARNEQEGRHRAVAAQKINCGKIPVMEVYETGASRGWDGPRRQSRSSLVRESEIYG